MKVVPHWTHNISVRAPALDAQHIDCWNCVAQSKTWLSMAGNRATCARSDWRKSSTPCASTTSSRSAGYWIVGNVYQNSCASIARQPCSNLKSWPSLHHRTIYLWLNPNPALQLDSVPLALTKASDTSFAKWQSFPPHFSAKNSGRFSCFFGLRWHFAKTRTHLFHLGGTSRLNRRHCLQSHKQLLFVQSGQ